jgi:hypothetical protein
MSTRYFKILLLNLLVNIGCAVNFEKQLKLLTLNDSIEFTGKFDSIEWFLYSK